MTDRLTLKTHSEYQPFADALRQAMTAAKLSASEVARRIWGTTKDKRGYEVAQNRDRISHYLAGTSYPNPSNLQKLADTIGVPIEKLKIERPEAGLRSARSIGGDLHLTTIADRPDKVRLQADRIIDWRLAAKIFEMLKEAELADFSVENASGTNLANGLENNGKQGPG